MVKQISYRGEMYKWLILAAEFILINAALCALLHYFGIPEKKNCVIIFDVSYMIANAFFPPLAHSHIVRSDQIATRVIQVTLTTATSHIVLFSLLGLELIPRHCIAAIFMTAFVVSLCSRLLFRTIFKKARTIGKNNINVVFVGAGVNLLTLHSRMMHDLSTGYRVFGYFDDKPYDKFDGKLPLLGDIDSVTKWLETHHVDMLFCNLPSRRSGQILTIINYCENHLVRFYSVPNVRNYVLRNMNMELFDDIPVMSIHREPMLQPMARLSKRAFDIIFSLLFLICIFWWVAIIVAIITKLTMPGPIFFCQKRNGRGGEVFTCIKFRSMRVNADADKLQATAEDPRTTKWGSIMRKTNIDELPQFVNVLLGDMSIVGPRPHMLLHTEEYGKLIDKYMVRHYAKPGITGWAQVTGCRGETRELSQMEERIEKDIWYMENWTFILDLRIIIMTVFNMFGCEKGNAY